MNTEQQNQEPRQVVFKLPTEVYKKIEKTANENERSVSAQLRFIINKYLETTEKN